jgi:hypothetical protein
LELKPLWPLVVYLAILIVLMVAVVAAFRLSGERHSAPGSGHRRHCRQSRHLNRVNYCMSTTRAKPSQLMTSTAAPSLPKRRRCRNRAAETMVAPASPPWKDAPSSTAGPVR